MDSNDLISALYHLQGSGTLHELAREVGTAMAQELHRLQSEGKTKVCRERDNDGTCCHTPQCDPPQARP